MSRSEPSGASGEAPQDLAGYEIVVGISGGIAVYKVCAVVSALIQRGAGVTCAMTRAATRFVRPLTFETLSGRRVITSLWRHEVSYDPQHIRLTDRADLILLAPATANILAKIAHGLADDLLSTLMTSVTCPVVVAPAMNRAMWANHMVQSNVVKLGEMGFRFVGTGEGWQACGVIGVGRMEEPPVIVDAVAELVRSAPPKASSS